MPAQGGAARAQGGGDGTVIRGRRRVIVIESPPTATVVRRRVIVVGEGGEAQGTSRGQGGAAATPAEGGAVRVRRRVIRVGEEPASAGGGATPSGSEPVAPATPAAPNPPLTARQRAANQRANVGLLRELSRQTGPDGRPTPEALEARRILRDNERADARAAALGAEAALRQIDPEAMRYRLLSRVLQRMIREGDRAGAEALARGHGLELEPLLGEPPRAVPRSDAATPSGTTPAQGGPTTPAQGGATTPAQGGRTPAQGGATPQAEGAGGTPPGGQPPAEAPVMAPGETPFGALRRIAREFGSDGHPTERALMARDALNRARRRSEADRQVIFDAALRRIPLLEGPRGSRAAAEGEQPTQPMAPSQLTPGLVLPARGAPRAELEAFVAGASRRDLLEYWRHVGNWAEGVRVEASGLSETAQRRLQEARQEIFDAAHRNVRAQIPESEARRQLAGSTGVTSDMDPTYLGPRTLEATRLFVDGFEAALRERGIPTEGWMEVFGVNPYSDPQLARFRITGADGESQAARDRLLGHEAEALEVQHYQLLMGADPSGARWRAYRERQIAAVEGTHGPSPTPPGATGPNGEPAAPRTDPAGRTADFFTRVEAQARALDAQLVAETRALRPELAGRPEPEVLAFLRSREGFITQRDARSRLLQRAREELARRIAGAEANPTLAQRESILEQTAAVKALEEEAYHPSAIQSVVEGQQEGHQMALEEGGIPISQPGMDPIARQNALVDSLNMIEAHTHQVEAMVAAAMRPVPGETRAQATERRTRQINDAMKPIAKYLARALIEARELGIPINSDLRVLSGLARVMRARQGEHAGAGATATRRGATMSTAEAEQIVMEANALGLTNEGQINMTRFMAEVRDLDARLRTSVAQRRALPPSEARAMTPDPAHPWRAAGASEPTSSPTNRTHANPRNRPRAPSPAPAPERR